MRNTYMRYRTTAEPNFVAAPDSRTANHFGNTIIVRLIWIGLAALTAWLIYRHWLASDTPTVPTEAPGIDSSAATPLAVHAPVTSAGAAVQPCVAISAECGSITPAGVRVSEGTTGYHTDADGRVRPDAPVGWIAMPDCKSKGLRVWVETNSQGDVLSYHCGK